MTNNSTGDPTRLSKMQNINIAVIGAAGVGKSTVIQQALGLKSLPTAVTSSLKMSVDNIIYTVTLVELALESFNVRSDRRVEWPKEINGEIMPRLDGSLLLYDVMNEESIADLPQTLGKLAVHCHEHVVHMISLMDSAELTYPIQMHS
jgi:GTPase SAR1 family protein